jgi:ribosomal protein S18 acetylase RimI-like enzyme
VSVGALVIRDAGPPDLEGIVRVDARNTGRSKPAYWRRMLEAYGRDQKGRVALVAMGDGGAVLGHLLGEIRAWEFGSEPCGWIFAVAVDPDHGRRGLARGLCRHAMARFRAMGVPVVRTMVRRNDVPVLSFFRSMGFVAGPFTEMEKTIEDEDLPDGGTP